MVLRGIKCSLDFYEEQCSSYVAHMKKMVIQGMGENWSKNGYEIADPTAVSRNLHSGTLRGD